MNKATKAEHLFLRNGIRKKKTGIRKKQMMQEEAMMQTMKLVKYKYLSVNIKTKK